jgi:hypothetical protein
MECYYGCGQSAQHTLKNGRSCCSVSYNSCPAMRAKVSSAKKAAGMSTWPKMPKTACRWCSEMFSVSNIKKHEAGCEHNPAMKVKCPVCGVEYKKWSSTPGRHSTTCSIGCANTYFRTGEDHWRSAIPLEEKGYIRICFHHHEKRCVVCGETKVVAVHHFDENHENNDPANLIPLCPTHHVYAHSKHCDEVMPTILAHIDRFKNS